MCEANAYMMEGEKEILIMKSVDKVTIEDQGLLLVNIFGEQKLLKARIHSLALVDHKILLEPR
ncbi:CooT family nickel-binding protein [Desulfatitalea alkaliphila]|uniref:CooT family nickel-binding protein n=1 Tax=Desulfatitalea alkaliphila TaxID=2929485 RepID=A0AA41R4H2_9BACT|nr:CooT family nickel-binding protein [Desulfatitalea alkaliphila]MCJ8501318.1 CooT family nickel-binding protein [Desulfatitalea alkaliphila]